MHFLTLKRQKVVLYGVHFSMDELKKLQAEENDAPKDLPRMKKKENKLNYVTLSNFQTISISTLEKDTSVSMNNCKCLYLCC